MTCPRTKLTKNGRDPYGEQVYSSENVTVRKETAANGIVYLALQVIAGEDTRAGRAGACGARLGGRHGHGGREAHTMRFPPASQLPIHVSCCSAGFSVSVLTSFSSCVSFLLLLCPLACGSVRDILCHQNYLMFPSSCTCVLWCGFCYI